NFLYRGVITSAERMKRLRQLDAPQAVLVREREILARALGYLVMNGEGALGKPRTGPSGAKLHSLATLLDERKPWPSLVELDGGAARGELRTLAPPLPRGLWGTLATLRALAISVTLA